MPSVVLSLLGLGLGALHASSVSAGQVPVVDGVIGGVRTSDSTTKNLETLASDVRASTPTPGALRVTENSGICETTEGVYQASGYGDLSEDESVWFWFFEARNNPDTAPLITWFNGGPGSSSMIGLFQELGPCRINNDSSTVSLNPYAWNEYANVLFIDQPVGVGFSYGTSTVGTSEEAASDVWDFMQIWITDERFSKYAANDFAIWTESYGGHYGPTFASYFMDQIAGIANGTVSGTPLNFKTLGIGNGLTDAMAQYPQYLTYSQNNPYHPLVSSTVYNRANTSMYSSNGCQHQIEACNNNGSNSVCSSAQSYCNNNVLSPLAGDYDVYYVLSTNDDYPPDITPYLTNSSITDAIGAEADWQETSTTVYDNFAATGDWMRTKSPYLEKVIAAGLKVVLYNGDADFICNYMGDEATIDALQTSTSSLWASQSFANYTVNGTVAGLYKNADNFSYIRFYGSGHEVPAYEYGDLARGQAALQMFEQIMMGGALVPT
ncbi:serine carboxypeptidase [Stereum hirsutum FP-91666 SS1]|uniref:serine carboxypeptidase n=1 Tax=Stereum hirsutum (strain FP-91666) TaxID=721885 RepID=UPI0004449B6D|nr:serine carboxypeptidase [Stereum hirsutum FP-91666 SS1]EIM82394.1 serine carboxypeptidase [Stereum hirsutum FP-91666 SS1]